MSSIPDVARQAAYLLEHRGWHRGDFWPGAINLEALTDVSPVCVSTALRLATHPNTHPMDHTYTSAEEDLAVWLQAMAFVHELETGTPHEGVVTYWNDYIAAGPAEVVTALRRFAADTAELDSREVAA